MSLPFTAFKILCNRSPSLFNFFSHLGNKKQIIRNCKKTHFNEILFPCVNTLPHHLSQSDCNLKIPTLTKCPYPKLISRNRPHLPSFSQASSVISNVDSKSACVDWIIRSIHQQHGLITTSSTSAASATGYNHDNYIPRCLQFNSFSWLFPLILVGLGG